MTSQPLPVCQIAVAVPLHQLFDYLWPFPQPPLEGQLVRVPFGRRQLYGVVMQCGGSTIASSRLKPVAEHWPECTLSREVLTLTRWCANYYHHPIGEVAATVLPSALLKQAPKTPAWRLTKQGAEGVSARGERQRAALSLLADGPVAVSGLRDAGIGSAVLRRMQTLGWVERTSLDDPRPAAASGTDQITLNADQHAAVEAVASTLGEFSAFLLHGVTGSGKTEVYLDLIERTIARGQQALVIVPEIGLTPQLAQRFERRLGNAVAVLHSQLPDRERAQAWRKAAAGEIAVVLGTRSAVFCPLATPALIVVDEEHDLSFKQQEGFRYSARDVAVQRARLAQLPVVLGSATPSLESLANCDRGRYQYLRLASRPGAATLPGLRLIDVRGDHDSEGLAASAVAVVEQHLARQEQVLVFLNRRGFAPVLLCNACGWSADCPRCDTRMTLHQTAGKLRCHHCGTARPVPGSCPSCQSTRLAPLGIGTQRLEQFLNRRFEHFPVWRIDRDSVRGPDAMRRLLAAVHSGEPGLLVGTQMLAKGHDFPNVTLVVVANIDQALYSSDFRSTERTAQLLVQVAGRAGRSSKAGQVLIQTHHPDHPLFSQVLASGYLSYARELLNERRAASYPPFGHMALIRAEAHQQAVAEDFLLEAMALAPADERVELLGPLPSPMARRAGRHRMQLLLNCQLRPPLHQLLTVWLPLLVNLKTARKVRWSVDVDPQDMF